MPKFVWKRVISSDSQLGYLGDIRIFTISWRLTKARDDPKSWTLRSGLPGHENLSIHGEKESDLMVKAAEEFDKWLKRVGVKSCPVN